jgi:hypothetical protein
MADAGLPRQALRAARIPPMLTLAAHIPLLLEIRASAVHPTPSTSTPRTRSRR